MENFVIIDALKRMRVETGSLVCLGCGHEHHCGHYGCTVINAAINAIVTLQEQLTASEIVRKDLGQQVSALGADNDQLRKAYAAIGRDLAVRTKQVRELQARSCFRCEYHHACDNCDDDCRDCGCPCNTCHDYSNFERRSAQKEERE